MKNFLSIFKSLKSPNKASTSDVEGLEKVLRLNNSAVPESSDPDGLPHPDDANFHKVTISGRSYWDLKPNLKSNEDSHLTNLFRGWAGKAKVSKNVSDNVSRLMENVLASPHRHLKAGATDIDPLKGIRTRHLKGALIDAGRDGGEYSVKDDVDGITLSATRHSSKGNNNVKQVTNWKIKNGQVTGVHTGDAESSGVESRGWDSSLDPRNKKVVGGNDGGGMGPPSGTHGAVEEPKPVKSAVEQVGSGVVRRLRRSNMSGLVSLAKSSLGKKALGLKPTNWRERNRAFAHVDGAGELAKADGKFNQRIRDIADGYAASKNLKLNHDMPRVDVNPEFAARVASAYHDMQHSPSHPDTKKAYDALIGETADQLHHLQRNGLKFSKIAPGMENPYKAGSKDLFRDIEENGHIWYYPTESGFGTESAGASDHPLLAPVKDIHGNEMPANDAFRIVHDVFGHVKEKHGFGPKGEENAWQHHVQMYSPDAAKALTAETRGQNSWVNFGPHGENNRKNPANTVYADQKAGILPDWAHDTLVGKPAQSTAASTGAESPKPPAAPKTPSTVQKSLSCRFAKSQTLEKRSKNVREQTRNITEEQATARRLQYAKRLGVSPFDRTATAKWEDSYKGFPDQQGNTLSYSKPFPVEHELAHAMMTPKGSNISNHTKGISDDEFSPASKTEENIASQIENRIDRRAGVGVGKKGGERAHANRTRFYTNLPVNTNDETEKYKSDHNVKLIYDNDKEAAKHLGAAFGQQARQHIERFDGGAKFKEDGSVAEPAGVNAKINSRVAKKSEGSQPSQDLPHSQHMRGMAPWLELKLREGK